MDDDRAALRKTGEAVRAELFGPSAAAAAAAQSNCGLDAFMSEMIYGSIWTRPGLSRSDRMMCTLAALCCVQYLRPLRAHVEAALHIGLSPATIVETLVQCGIYAGFPASDEAIRIANEVFAGQGVPSPAPARTDPLSRLTARGHEVMNALHGDRGTQGYGSPDNAITSSLYPLIIQYCYGEIWDRPGLDLRQRALCAVAAFTALDLTVQFRKFALSARNVGASETEIIEAVIQTGPYTGLASALNSLTILSEVFARPTS
jgi:4-carboxymuconolactone decarboxylase